MRVRGLWLHNQGKRWLKWGVFILALAILLTLVGAYGLKGAWRSPSFLAAVAMHTLGGVVPDASTTVNITDPALSPSCSLKVSKDSITRGEKTSLKWSANKAVSGKLNQDIGSIASLASGSYTITPLKTTTYTATFVSAAGKTADCSVKVMVSPSVWEERFGDSLFLTNRMYFSTDSHQLAWEESYVLEGLLTMYETTHDLTYMGRARLHITTMLASASLDAARDHYGWETSADSTDGKSYPSVAHDGMILYPIAHFVRLVKENPKTLADYKGDADDYLNVLESKFLKNWSSAWVEKGSLGYYVVPVGLANSINPKTYPVGSTMPYNYMAAYGRFLLEMNQITNNTDYRQKAIKLGNTLHAAMKGNGSQYVWNYAGQLVSKDPTTRPTPVEDASHANIDVGFALNLYRAGIVFDRTDMLYLANTFLNYLWDDSEGLLNQRVDGSNGTSVDYSSNLTHWVEFAAFKPEIADIAAKLLADPRIDAYKSPTYVLSAANMARYTIDH